MTSDHVDDVERSTTRRSVLKAGLVASAVGIGGTATGLAQTDDEPKDDAKTHTLTVGLVDSDDADIVSGDVTVDGQTKTTAPVDGDPATIQTTFELEDGTHTVSASSELRDETWHANDQEVTIDGDDKWLSLNLYPPESDELENDPDTETHTLTAALVESGEGDIVSGDVTVDGQTKTTAPVDGDPAKVLTTFELENGTYTVSASSDFQGETWRANDQEVTIDGADESVSLLLYPPGSDELEDDPDGEEDTGGDGDTSGEEDSSSEGDTSGEEDTEGTDDDPDETAGDNTDETDETAQDGGANDADDTDETDGADDQQQSSTIETPDTDCPKD